MLGVTLAPVSDVTKRSFQQATVSGSSTAPGTGRAVIANTAPGTGRAVSAGTAAGTGRAVSANSAPGTVRAVTVR